MSFSVICCCEHALKNLISFISTRNTIKGYVFSKKKNSRSIVKCQKLSTLQDFLM
jgi:hypothetical protein